VELLAQLRSVILLKSFSKVYVVWNTVVMTLPVWLVDAEGHMTRLRRLGKVQMLAQRRKNIRCTVVPVLRTPAGRRTANRLKATRTRMCLNTLWSCTTALSKTTNRCAKC
jgi:hypothetical protein